MGIVKRNDITTGLSGAINKQLVFKQYKHGTVVTKYPDRSKVKLSEKQVAANERFKLAVEYARAILADPEKKAAFAKKLPEGKTVYYAALSEYLKENRG
ncbi:hypothetical protein GS399_13165 [Pedobacter sp. HMF7647]|uniref:Uncharacterized protein n=1 Tax=Hufsiella arboris TaxID=2695275 RepID=A0A7K1YBG9_9SPHI|nr:hypothetical protein [Hufsiella arboris]MXV51926.1 hypothetical protein [Hufsiella arboris]